MSTTNTFGTPSFTATKATRLPSGETSGPSVEPCWSFGESLNSTYLFPSVSRLRFFPSASTRYTSPSRRTKTIVLPSGRELRDEALGVVGRQFDRLAVREHGEQEPVAPCGAGEHHAVVRRAEPGHVGVAEAGRDERGCRAVRVGDHHPAARAVVDGEDHPGPVRGEGVAERLLHVEPVRALQLLREFVGRRQARHAGAVPPAAVDLRLAPAARLVVHPLAVAAGDRVVGRRPRAGRPASGRSRRR